MVPAIEVVHVAKRYGALCALDCVGLDVAQGEFLAHADVWPRSLGIVVACFVAPSSLTLWLFRAGCKLRH
jgi:hypothetical protein